MAKSCVMYRGFLRVLVIPEQVSGELNDPKTPTSSHLSLTLRVSHVILLSVVLWVFIHFFSVYKKWDLGKQVSEPNEVFCVTVCIQFFLCQCLCIQKMNVFKNDNWPGDYSLCSYLSMSASLLTDCCLVSQRKVQGLARWHLPPEY